MEASAKEALPVAEAVITVAILVIAALALVFLEVFIPSFGVITLVACTMYGLALWTAYRADPALMRWTLAVSLPLVPLTIWLAFKLLPYSPLVLRSRKAPEPDAPLAALVGLEGVVVSDLRPVGKVEVDGARHEAVCRHGMIERGERVRVKEVQSGRLVVTQAVQESKSARVQE